MHLLKTLFTAGCAVVVGLLAHPVHATDLEFDGGKSLASSRSTDAAFIEAAFHEYRLGNSVFTLAPDVSVGWIGGRNLSQRIDGYGLRQDAWLFSAGGRLRVGQAGDWYHNFFLSFQPAANFGRTIALSSPLEFNTSIGWGWHHFDIRVRHISNAGYHEPNRGETMLLAGVHFSI
ncbi:acyloxyacyl hydrolase [Frateuria aurantia]